ncbi:MAG: hypothetical protein HY323_09240 [Betaproteobacteria bacterium]|nr:hypothetical protein [Betaproteobacteria bacterium]
MDDERELGELRARLEGLCAAFDDFRDQTRAWQDKISDQLERRLNQHSSRLRALELWRAGLAGGLALLGILWAAVWTWMKR